MKKFRIIFSDGPMGDRHKSYDVEAENSDEAFQIAYRKPEAQRYDLFTNISVEEIPEGASPIGIRFSYYDTYAKRNFTDYLVIKANDEKQAVEYYNSYYRGKHFSFNVGEIEEIGKHIYGNVVETYFAACPGYHADATARMF